MEWLLFILAAIAVWMFMSYSRLRRLVEYVKRCHANIAAVLRCPLRPHGPQAF
ncbi:hypothetical protein GRI97_14025 [Altererythrobacter xixiisoli]|uniref:Uncharacterized protein n=1 Tax=Croceibacterium xixiisoli TaxID=1476466 RepID=A0A6I4TV66_9SPHN|nr:LemA family protein [Croceibacterium xixiisoli]MXP00106.1 hypothetical protein [Croceibacterium xixiisoli]